MICSKSIDNYNTKIFNSYDLPIEYSGFDVGYKSINTFKEVIKRSKKIINILKDGELTGWEVTKKLFSRPLDAMNLRLAFQETMAHLKYIESQGKIKQKVSEVNTWSLT